MNEELLEIQKYVIEVYQKNLIFLKENFYDIFQEVEDLSLKIESGEYKEEYSLEMMQGYFDIKNLENGGYYYAANSYEEAEQRAFHVDHSIKSSIDLLRKVHSTNILAIPHGLEEVVPVVGFINKTVDLDNISFQKIMKNIYIGVGLGFHIQEMDKKLESYTTLIIEPELEIFRLSLFTTDYSEFAKGSRKLFLSIGDDKNKREGVLHAFYNYHSYMNYNIKYYKLLENHEYIKSEIEEFCHHNYVGAFPYKSVIKNIHRTLDFIKEKDRFLVFDDSFDREKVLGDKKVLLVSAGPSLDNYIEIIKEHQDKFVIASVDVIVRKLEKNGIVPDIVFSIDPSHLCAQYLTTEDPEYLKNSIIILLSQQHPETMKVLRERKLTYYVSQFTNLIKDIGTLGSLPNVGTFSFHAIAHLGAKEMYTIGNDAAFNQDTGARYSSDSSYTQTEKTESNKANDNAISMDDILEVKGNLRETIKTNRSLIAFKYTYDAAINNMSRYLHYKAYNLSDGVYIDGLEPMTKEKFLEISTNEKKKQLDLKVNFDQISKVIDDLEVDEDIKVINSILQRAKKFQKTKIKDRDDFLAKKLDLMIWILEKAKVLKLDVIGHVFLDYTHLVDSYINFFLNLQQKGLYTKENLEHLRDEWSKGVLLVFKDIKKSVDL
jgi:hypothetical protein